MFGTHAVTLNPHDRMWKMNLEEHTVPSACFPSPRNQVALSNNLEVGVFDRRLGIGRMKELEEEFTGGVGGPRWSSNPIRD